MHRTHCMLPETVREKSVALLNKHLAAAFDLHAQMKQAHWNVRSSNCIAIHELFDKVASEVEGYSDRLAERAAGLGGTAHGTIQIAVARSFLFAYTLGIGDVTQHVFAVSGALTAFGQSVSGATGLAAKFGDADTADLFTEISRGVYQQLWFVESPLLAAPFLRWWLCAGFRSGAPVGTVRAAVVR